MRPRRWQSAWWKVKKSMMAKSLSITQKGDVQKRKKVYDILNKNIYLLSFIKYMAWIFVKATHNYC